MIEIIYNIYYICAICIIYHNIILYIIYNNLMIYKYIYDLLNRKQSIKNATEDVFITTICLQSNSLVT